MTAVVVSLAIATIPTVARVTRASALVVMGQDFIEAGRAIGPDHRTLLTRYLALNCISSVFVYFKTDKPGVDDPVVRRAMVMAVDQEAISRDLNFGETEPAYSYLHRSTPDWIPRCQEPMRIAASNRLAEFRARNIYGCGLYKGLGLRFVR